MLSSSKRFERAHSPEWHPIVRRGVRAALLTLAIGCATPPTEVQTEDSDTGTAESLPPPRIYINEISANNQGAYQTPDSRTPDWLELYNAESQEVSLDGWWITDDYTQPRKHALPAELIVPPGGHLVLHASGATAPTGIELPFRVSAEREGLGLFLPDGQLVDWVVVGPLPADHVSARLPDGSESWATLPLGTPAAPNQDVLITDVELIPPGSVWAFDDRGEDLGDMWWTQADTPDTWPTGAGPLGYGDDHIVTEVAFGDDPDAKHITTYFLNSFDVDEPPQEVELSLMVDDGALVWLDGQEVFRRNLPEGPISFETPANQAVGGEQERTFITVEVDAGLLSVGRHTLAVEVHQANALSSDLTFDASLQGITVTRQP